MNPITIFRGGLAKSKRWLATLDQRINESTFGRVFRLDGSGHVSYHYTPFKHLRLLFVGAGHEM